MTKEQLAKMIDHTNLKPFIENCVWKELCETANDYGFKTVAINNAGIAYCSKQFKLLGSDVLIDAAIGFPLGASTMETKIFEAEDAIKKGASEVDYVMNISELKNKNYQYIEDEMQGIVDVCKSYNVTSKVILENCYLTDEEKIKVCEIAVKTGIDFVKTSTGFGTGGATVEDVRLMKSIVKDACKVKAAGGIRSYKDALAMIEAGADRIGTSQGVKIMDEFTGVFTENSENSDSY